MLIYHHRSQEAAAWKCVAVIILYMSGVPKLKKKKKINNEGFYIFKEHFYLTKKTTINIIMIFKISFC